MKSIIKKNIERRKFFKTIGLSSLGLGFFSFITSKLAAFNRLEGKSIKVKIHPSAVKRNK